MGFKNKDNIKYNYKKVWVIKLEWFSFYILIQSLKINYINFYKF